MSAIAFLGKDEVTELERDRLETLGHLLAEDGHQLHVPTLTGAAGALAAGWSRTAGRPPDIHKKALHRSAPDLVLYCDDDLLAKVLGALPIDCPELTIVRTIEELTTFCEIAMGVLDEKGKLTA